MKKAKIYYTSLPDEMLKEEKLTWFRENPLEKIAFERITPDEKGNWINLADNSEWDTLLAVCDKDVKGGKSENAIFKLFSNGVMTDRDEWIYDFDKKNLIDKMKFFANTYNNNLGKAEYDLKIKWTATLKDYFKSNIKNDFDEKIITKAIYRPFTKVYFYADKIFNDRLTRLHFDTLSESLNNNNILLSFTGISSSAFFSCLVTSLLYDRNFYHHIPQYVPLYIYDKNGNRQENITDWALGEFRRHYADVSITKEAIFYYVYAVLHTPQYRAKYEQNLKRDFPRIPYYADFQYFSERGKALADLHIGYESVTPYPLELVEKTSPKKDYLPKPKLKANKENGEIELDELTLLRGIPSEAWAYKLGNRTALEWILDQYKESKPSDKTIAEHFNTYQFSDYKATVIDLLRRVCRVSVETVRIVGELDAKM
jgi:predicted helicase